MSSKIRSFSQLLSLFALTATCGFTQQTNPDAPITEVHAGDMRKVVTAAAIDNSAGCRQVRELGHFVYDERKVDPATFAPDLRTLMEKSDEVVLVAIPFADAGFLSHGGQDMATYADAKVLRTWKGSHKVGETITYALPEGGAECHGPGLKLSDSIVTHTGGPDWLSRGWGPYVLFLRRSQGQEAEFMPGLRLTGGSGLQGIFLIPYDLHVRGCTGISSEDREKCKTTLESSTIPISVRYRRDPLFKRYDGMPTAEFIKEIQQIADGLQGYVQKADAGK